MSEADAGTSRIASLFAGMGPASTLEADGPGLEADAAIGLHVAVGNLVSELRAEARRKAQLAADVSYLSAPAIPLPSLPTAISNWGPGKGWCWAVQRITIAGFGATTDFVIAYRGTNTTDAAAANALFTFQEAVAGGTATWHPGRTGLVLRGDEGLVFGGTLTGAAAVVSVDVIQLADAKMPYFLL